MQYPQKATCLSHKDGGKISTFSRNEWESHWNDPCRKNWRDSHTSSRNHNIIKQFNESRGIQCIKDKGTSLIWKLRWPCMKNYHSSTADISMQRRDYFEGPLSTCFHSFHLNLHCAKEKLILTLSRGNFIQSGFGGIWNCPSHTANVPFAQRKQHPVYFLRERKTQRWKWPLLFWEQIQKRGSVMVYL